MSKALRQFTFGKGKSAGRNSQGRITSFHRGGGAKRLQRVVDLKRNTSSMGIVERIEYDPNRSSRIALVRWIEGIQPGFKRKNKVAEGLAPPLPSLETSATARGPFSFCWLPGKPAFSSSNDSGSKFTCPNDVFRAYLAKGESDSFSSGGSFAFPRVAVAGAKPDFFAPRMRGKDGEKETFSLLDIRKWRKDSVLWGHRIKRRAAVSWQSLGSNRETLGLVAALDSNGSKPKYEKWKGERAPMTYVIGSHQLKPGMTVMNCDWSKLSTAN